MFRYVDALCLLPPYMYPKTHTERERERERDARAHTHTNTQRWREIIKRLFYSPLQN